jgi:hypothetical protein
VTERCMVRIVKHIYFNNVDTKRKIGEATSVESKHARPNEIAEAGLYKC